MKKLVSLLLALVMALGCIPAMAVAEEPVTLSMFVDEWWWPYSDWTGEMPQWFTEQTGINFDVTVAADTTELSMMVVSDTLPDIVVTSQLNMMASGLICYDWPELIEKYGLDAKIHPAYQFVNTAADGGMYTIAVGWSADYEYAQYPTVNPEGTCLAMRKDIKDACMEKVGITEITTVEELEACFDACLELYPDVVPLTIHDALQATRYVEALYGAGHANLVDLDGKATYYIYDEKYETALVKMNEWVRKGYVTAENFSWNGLNIAQDQVAAGKVFAIASLTSAPQNMTNIASEAGLDHVYEALATCFTPDSKELSTDAGFRGLYITKNCSNPEAAIKAALALTSKDIGYCMLWGIEGEDWQWNEDHSEAELFWTTADSELMDRKQFLWGWLGHDGISNNMQYSNTPANRVALSWVGAIIDRNPVLGIVMNKLDSESDEYILLQNLNELKTLYSSRIILASSEEEAHALYAEMIQNADNMGGQDFNAWANELYPTLMAEYETVRGIGPEGWEK